MPVLQWAQHGANVLRRDGGQVTLEVDDDLGLAVRVDLAECLENAVRAGRMVAARHVRLYASRFRGSGDLGCIGGHHDAADSALEGSCGNLSYNRISGDIG